MVPRITCQTILVPAGRSGPVEPGFLVFADNVLMAVVMLLDQSVGEDLRGLWFVETGYGSCSVAPGADHTFKDPDEARRWVRGRVTRAGVNAAA